MPVLSETLSNALFFILIDLSSSILLGYLISPLQIIATVRGLSLIHISRIRKKLEEAGLRDFIRTRKGLGYLIEEKEHD